MDLFEVLLIIFIVLKLCGVIAWSWWWVLSPLWIGFLLHIFLYLLIDFFRLKYIGKFF